MTEQNTSSPLKLLNLLVAFLVELALLASLGYWGFHTEHSSSLHWLLGLGAPLLIAAIWSVLGAPKSPRRLPQMPLAVFRIVLCTATAIGLIVVHQKAAGIVFETVSVANTILAFIWKQ